MADIELGSKFEWLQHIVTLKSVGRIKVLVGRGVVIGVGTSARGPAMTLTGMIRSSQPYQVFRSGPLKDDMETALDQACDAVFGYRLMGAGYASATLELVDGATPAVPVGTLDAVGPGVWGNIPIFWIEDGDQLGSKLEVLPGTGQTTPYTLLRDDIRESDYNYVHVGSTVKTVVYSGPADPGEAYYNKVTGQLSFATGEWPTANQQIAARYKHGSRKLSVLDNDGRPKTVLNNIMSLEQLTAKLYNSSIANFNPAYGATHLPKILTDSVCMAGGSDGSAITTDDWEIAFNDIVDRGLPGNIVATSIFTTAYEVVEGTMDLVPYMDAFLWKMADKKRPLQGFMCMDPTMTPDEMRDFKEGYTNLWMTLIGNGFSASGRNLAPARAGQEAGLGLSISAATDSNSLKGIDGLSFQFSDPDRRSLTDVGIEVLIKETGVHPYLGVGTDVDPNFFRTVDVRTIAEWIVLSDFTVQKFMNERRTLTNLKRLQTSLQLILHTMLRKSVLDDANLTCSADPDNHNGVIIDSWIQPVGHMEQFDHSVSVGYWSDAVAA